MRGIASLDVMRLGLHPTGGELDARQVLHKDIFDKLKDSINEVFDQYIGKLAFINYCLSGHDIKSDDPNNFDTITS